MSNSRTPSFGKATSKPNQIRPHSFSQQPPEALLTRMPADVIRFIGSMLDNKGLAKLSESYLGFYHVTQRDRTLRKLLQAVVDNDEETAASILDADPSLAVVIPSPNIVIESKLTWQRFKAESAWKMAGMRQQAGMVEFLRSYIDELDDASKAAALAQWRAPDVNNPEEKTLLDARNKKLQEDYRKFLQPLADVISREPCANGYDGQLGEETEKALSAFRNTTLPDAAVRLDDYYDINQLLIAAYETYGANFNVFPDWNQRYVFCIKVIGWIMSLVQPELGQIFCESLWHVVEKGQQIGEQAAAYIMKDKVKFYRATRDSLDGLGGKFLCDEYYASWGVWQSAEAWRRGCGSLQNYVKQTTQNLANSCSHCVIPSSVVPRR